MRVRKIARKRKVIQSDTGWKTGGIPPRDSGIFPKTRPISGGWKWRSGKVRAENEEFVLLAQCNPGKDNWKSWLIFQSPSGPALVARLEHHGTHPGLHIHTDCDRSGVEVGGSSISNLGRLPAASSRHRRDSAWTEAGFWEAAKNFFRISEEKGSLI